MASEEKLIPSADKLQLIWIDHHTRAAFHECYLCRHYERKYWGAGESSQHELDVGQDLDR